jgi:hypothetical protein
VAHRGVRQGCGNVRSIIVSHQKVPVTIGPPRTPSSAQVQPGRAGRNEVQLVSQVSVKAFGDGFVRVSFVIVKIWTSSCRRHGNSEA